MKKLNLALLSGGISSEREVSLNSGDQVFEALDKEKYNILRYDPKTDLERMIIDAPRIDAALIILHGPYGEDGTVQGLLDLLRIPYQGSGVLGSAVAMNKIASKQFYEKAGVPTPPYLVLQNGSGMNLDNCASKFGFPMVVKPVVGGSSVGMSIVRSENSLTTFRIQRTGKKDSCTFGKRKDFAPGYPSRHFIRKGLFILFNSTFDFR